MLNKRPKSSLVFSLITAIILSSSFCLHILAMDAMAAGPMNSPAAASQAGTQMMAVAAIPPCCPDCGPSSGQSLAGTAAANMLNCCSAQTLNPTITSARPDLFSHFAAAMPAAAAVVFPSSLAAGNNYQQPILSPPQAAALRSVVKLE